jgi:F-type H+-transporting ATPase subunit a
MHESTWMDLFIDPHVVPHYVSYAFLGSLLLIAMALLLRGSMALVPRGFQNAVEAVAEAILNLNRESLGRTWGDRFIPLTGTIFIYILVCNLMGLIPGFAAPTSDINVTASMALPVFLATHYYGLKVHGPGYIKHFLGPVRSLMALPLMMLIFVIEIIGHLARPVTLSVRLFGNMTGKHIILIVLAILAPAVVPFFILALGVLVSVVQALVFCLLSVLYLAGAIEEAH